MSTIVESSNVRARKPHRCFVCRQTIPLGELHRKDVLTEGWSTQTRRAHINCLAAHRPVGPSAAK